MVQKGGKRKRMKIWEGGDRAHYNDPMEKQQNNKRKKKRKEKKTHIKPIRGMRLKRRGR